jgi:hypothetical protein
MRECCPKRFPRESSIPPLSCQRYNARRLAKCQGFVLISTGLYFGADGAGTKCHDLVSTRAGGGGAAVGITNIAHAYKMSSYGLASKESAFSRI